jgi:nickel/cobalt exporter
VSGGVFWALALAAVSVGSLHSLTPDHWVPFAAVARSRNWSAFRTARVTFFCGLGHVTASVILGLLGLFLGVELMETLGHRMGAVAGLGLIAFGLIYAMWGLRQAAGRRLHGHAHGHYDHVHEPSRITAWSLFLLFSADPCVAVIPLLFAAAPLGALETTAIVLLYEVATIGTMILLVLPARAGVRVLRSQWLDRYGDAVAGGLVAAVGVAVALLGW